MNKRKIFFNILLFIFGLLPLARGGESQETIELLKISLSQSDDPTEKIILLKKIGQRCHDAGRLEEATSSYRQIVFLARQMENSGLEENALQSLGVLYFDQYKNSSQKPSGALGGLLFLTLTLGGFYWARSREKSLQNMLFLKEQQILKNQKEVARLNKKYRKSQKFLKKEKEGIEQNNKELQTTVEDLKSFAYMATHDLKEPLRTIGSYAGLIKRRYKDRLDEDGQQFLSFITHGIGRMNNLVNEILHYAGLQSSFEEKELEWIDTNELIADLAGELQHQIEGKNAKLILKNNLPRIKVDRNHLFQIFQNLISNGLKYNDQKEPIVELDCFSKGQSYVFSVCDNGIGMDMAYKEKIFEVFQRLHGKEKYEGTGIGLAIVKKLITFYGGEIWVESGENQGSQFYFTFPVNQEELALV